MGTFNHTCNDTEKRIHNSGFGNRPADGRIDNSLLAAVAKGNQQIFAFCIYLQPLFFNWLCSGGKL